MYNPGDKRTLEIVEKVRGELESKLLEHVGHVTTSAGENSAPGDLGAENVSGVDDEFDSFMFDILQSLVDEYDMDPEDASDFIYDCADELADQGDLPPIPGDEAPDSEVSLWVGKAKTWGFESFVFDAAVDDGYGEEDYEGDASEDDTEE